MYKYSAHETVPYMAQQLFDLALDIQSYPEFLPICKGAEVGEWEDLGDRTFAMDSMLLFRFGKFGVHEELRKFGIHEEFNSRVIADLENKTIISESNDMPFKSFRAVWTFMDISKNESEVNIDVAYEFRSLALAMFINRNMGIGIRYLMQAWRSRAHEVCGNVHPEIALSSHRL